MKQKLPSLGFTLIELLIAISIIGILGVVIITSAAIAQRQARDDQRQGDLKKLQLALQQYYTDQGFFPDSSFSLSGATNLTNCTTLSSCTATRTYLSTIPLEPNTASGYPAYCYQAYTDSSKAACDNTSTTVTNHCRYFSLFAKLENPPSSSTTFSCGALSTYNLEINPL